MMGYIQNPIVFPVGFCREKGGTMSDGVAERMRRAEETPEEYEQPVLTLE